MKVFVFDYCKTFNYMLTCIRDENLSRKINIISYKWVIIIVTHETKQLNIKRNIQILNHICIYPNL